MKTPYFYIINDKRSGKKYAGCRYAKNCNTDELLRQDGYQTSSKLVKNIIKKYGIDIFEVVLIKTEEECNMHVHTYEQRWLKDHDCINRKEYYNQYRFNSGHSPEFNKKLLERYGISNISQLQSIKEKKKISYMKKYGVKHNSMIPEVKEKKKISYMKKYGVDNPSKSQIIKNKKYDTSLINYGVSHHTKLTDYKEQFKHRIIELRRNDPILICPHCNKTMKGKGVYNRWHGNNCKSYNAIIFPASTSL